MLSRGEFGFGRVPVEDLAIFVEPVSAGLSRLVPRLVFASNRFVVTIEQFREAPIVPSRPVLYGLSPACFVRNAFFYCLPLGRAQLFIRERLFVN